VEATTLAAHPDNRRAATIMVRRLVQHADAIGMAVSARPRTEAVATAYRRLGFRPVPGGAGRILIRPPGALAPTRKRAG
jgi:hypothetical protein